MDWRNDPKSVYNNIDAVLAENEMITLISHHDGMEAHTRMTVNPEEYRDHFFPLSPWLRSIQDLIIRDMEKRLLGWTR